MTTITLDRALLEQELEFLNRVTHWQEGRPDLHDRKVALRKALEQPEQEPVAWVVYRAMCEEELVWSKPKGDFLSAIPLYAKEVK